MNRLSLQPLLEELEREPGPESGFVAKRLSYKSEARLGLSRNGIALLVPTDPGIPRGPDLRLESVTLLNCAECTLIENGIQTTGFFGIVECLSADSELRATFVEVLEWMLPADGNLGIREAQLLFERIARLVRELDKSMKGDALGLWGELFVMSHALAPLELARAWHVSPSDRWDFASNNFRLEVKTTTSGHRRHHFSYEQLVAPAGTVIWIASITTTVSPSGPSVRDLLDVVISQSPQTEHSRLIEVAIASLGRNWPAGSLERFDDLLALDSLRFYDSVDIPRVADPPCGVSEVRFVVDFVDLPAQREGIDAPSELLNGRLFGSSANSA